MPFSTPEETAANRPLPLDDPESVWWITGGQVDVFFTLPGLDGQPGTAEAPLPGGGGGLDLRDQRRPEPFGRRPPGRGRRHGDAAQVRSRRPDPPELRGAAGRAGRRADRRLDPPASAARWIPRRTPGDRQELPLGRVEELAPGTRFGIRQGVAWIRHLEGTSRFLDEIALPVSELEARFPLSEHLWLSAGRALPGDGVRHLDHGSLGRPLGRAHGLSTVPCSTSWPGSRSEKPASAGPSSRRTIAGERHARGRVLGQARRGGQPDGRADRADGRRCPAGGLPGRGSGAGPGGPARPERAPTTTGRTAARLWRRSPAPPGFHVRQVTLPHDWARAGAASPCWPSSPARTAGPWPCCPGATAARAASPPAGTTSTIRSTDRRQPVDESQARQVGPTAWMFYRTLPDHPLRLLGPASPHPAADPAARSDWWSSWRCSPGCWDSPCRSARASWSIRSSRRSISPAPGRARLLIFCVFLAGLAVDDRDPPGRRALDLAPDRGQGRAVHRPRGLGSPASAPHAVLRRLLLGRPGAAGHGPEPHLQEGLRRGRHDPGHRADLSVQPRAACSGIAGGWR